MATLKLFELFDVSALREALLYCHWWLDGRFPRAAWLLGGEGGGGLGRFGTDLAFVLF